MAPNPSYRHNSPADYAPHTHHSSSRAEGRRYRGERPPRERNIPPPPWPTSPAGSHATHTTSSDYYGFHGGYYQPPSSTGHHSYAPRPPQPRHVPPPAATPPTVSNAPSPAIAHNLPPNLPSGIPPAPPPPPTISPPPPGGVDQYSYYPPPHHHPPHDPHLPHHPHHPPPPHHYYPPPLHPLDDHGAPSPDYHHPRSHRDPRDRDFSRPPPRDRNYSIPQPMDEYSIPTVPPPPPLGRYGSFSREDRYYGVPSREDYMPPPADPRDYRPPRGRDYRLPMDLYASWDYSMDPDYLHPDSRGRPKSEYEVEYQSAPPSGGSSAVTRDDDGEGYSSIPPPPPELEYDGSARKEIEYPTRARSRARSIKEIEYHISKSRAASRAPSRAVSMAPSTRDPHEVREIEYLPHSQPPPDPPSHEGMPDLDYPPPGVREIEYMSRPGTSHSKRESDLGPAPPVVRPPDPAIVTQPHWPPPRDDPELEPKDAADLISNGTPLFRGNLREIVGLGAPKGAYSFYVSAGNEWDEDTDCAAFQEAVYGDMSSATTQDKALERPAMCHAFGRYPGTITLSCYVAGFSSTWRAGVSDVTGSELSLQSTGGGRIRVRKLSMIHVVDRLRNLQDRGIEENEPALLHDHIYNFLLYEPPRPNQTGYSVETQISDLISALLRPSWIDFSLPENQVISRFLRSTEPGVTNAFFHQLLLALELYLRIGIVRPQAAIAEKVSWDLVLAQRWLENVEIQPPKVAKEGSSSVSFGFKNKESQVDALKEFAWTLKWPNMHEVSYTLTEEDSPSNVLEDRSTACMAWFTGLILPGNSMPFILMNALTDCDPDTPSSFHDLPCTAPNVGFQYRGHTYWSWECIVGKVLGAAKGVSQIAGWLGPCISSPDLDRAEVTYINQRKTPDSSVIRLSAADVRNMQAASDPLGPKLMGNYKTVDYDLIIPDSTQQTDTIRIERLNFAQAAPLVMDSGGTHSTVAGTVLEEVASPLSAPTKPISPLNPAAERQPPQQPPLPASSSTLPVPGGAAGAVGLGIAHLPNSTTGGSLATSAPHVPRAQSPKVQISTFDASITFAISHRSWKVNLRYDTPFIAAYPCTGGPHVLYNKYYYRAVKVDSLVEIENWGPRAARTEESSSGGSGGVRRRGRRAKHKQPPPRTKRKGSRHPNATRSEDEDDSCSESDLSEGDDGSASYVSSPSRSSPSSMDEDEEVVDEDGFSHLSHTQGGRGNSSLSSSSPPHPQHLTLNNTLDEVLVVEAFGVHDNEVFARAWCSFWGVSAIITDLRKTCFACGVREAYAVGVSVVVVVDGQAGARRVGEMEVEEVDRMMEGLYV